MRIDDIDIYHLPKWLEGIFEDIESLCNKTLKKESEAYRKILNETYVGVDGIIKTRKIKNVSKMLTSL